MGWLAAALALLLSLSGGLACGEASTPGAEGGASASSSSGPANEVEPVSTAAQPRRSERPLPAFQGFHLDGSAVDFAELIGRRTLVFLFNPEVEGAVPVAEAVATIEKEAAAHNFRVLGVAHGSTAEKSQAFVTKHGLAASVVDDLAARVSGLLGLRVPVGLVLVDAKGFLTRGSGRFPLDATDPAALIEAELREWLRLPVHDALAVPALGDRPLAPDFSAPRLEGGEPFRLSEHRGEPLALIFFLHTCPHCHHALEAFKDALPRIPEAKRPKLVGISMVDRAAPVREQLKADGLDFFPVLFDRSKIRASFGAEMSVPVVFLIDAEGRIVSRTDGWRDERDPPLLRMRLAELAGAKVPMLLHRDGYSGDEFCGVCHSRQHDSWLLTSHARAFETLVRHGEETNAECIGCHVVGFGERSGYQADGSTPHYENVGCETCHGRGGPHLSPEHAKDGQFEKVCLTCHDTKHSLGFDYASFVPRVSHAANARFAGLSLEEKRALLEEQRRPRSVLPSDAAYVGSAVCRDCHAEEYATWSGQPHARAVASLAGKGEAGNPECLSCHTTGYERPGGFPAGAAADAHPALAAVGCESCHGPGGDHVKPDATRRGSIVSLTDKCDSCVILQICGACHDDANDPGFEFEVQDKIDRQRHGNMELPGAGAGLAPAFHHQLGALEAALRAHGSEG